jgi:hypothetical protein
MTLGRLMQELCKSRHVHRSPHPALEPLGDLLKQPPVAVGVGKRRVAAVRGLLRVGAELAFVGRHVAAPVEDLADVHTAADQLVPGRVDVVDDQHHVLHRARLQRRHSRTELDRGR